MSKPEITHKICIITEDDFAILGRRGMESLMDVGIEKGNPVHLIDDFFLEKLQKMPTYDVGFTLLFKLNFIEMLTRQRGKYCLFTDDNLKKLDGSKEQIYLRIVELLNEGKTLEEASKLAQSENGRNR